jgi:hypothetical protein
MKLLLKKSALLVSVASMALGSQAFALSIDLSDLRYLGFIDPSTPASATQEAISINDLRGVLPAGEPVPVLADIDGTGAVTGADVGRTGVATTGTPAATATGATQGIAPSGTSINITGYSYLLAKYGTTAHVWYVAGLTGTQSIPLNEPSSLGGQGQSHYSVYNPGTSVPDGGATVALLGLGLAALAMVRRKIAA